MMKRFIFSAIALASVVLFTACPSTDKTPPPTPQQAVQNSVPAAAPMQGGNYGQTTFTTVFLEILRSLGIRGPKGQGGPRVHDFRHSFAVNRLLAWYREGCNLAAKLPLLSIYLGHSTVTCTEVYLHATAELLEKTGQRFHTHFAVPPLNRKKPHAKN